MLVVLKSVKQMAIVAALAVAATAGISSPALAANYQSYRNDWTDATCLDSNSAGEAYTLGCNTGSNQDWDVQFISGTSYYLKNRATGLCLDGNAAGKVYTLSCNGGTNQRWRRVGSPGQWINIQTAKCLTGSVYTDKRVVFQAVCSDSDDAESWTKL